MHLATFQTVLLKEFLEQTLKKIYDVISCKIPEGMLDGIPGAIPRGIHEALKRTTSGFPCMYLGGIHGEISGVIIEEIVLVEKDLETFLQKSL